MDIISLCSGGGLWDWAWKDAGANIVLMCEKLFSDEEKEKELKKIKRRMKKEGKTAEELDILAEEIEVQESIQVRILEKDFPDVPIHGNIFNLNRKEIESHGIDPEKCTIIGGLCCQPFSLAGNQRGRYKDTWMCDELVRITGECKPRFVVAENVYGFIGHTDGLSYLSKQMESIGYYGHSLCIPACAFGAPHQRERVFALYYRDNLSDLVRQKALADPESIRRYICTIADRTSLRAVISKPEYKQGFYNRRSTVKPGIRSLAYGSSSRALRDYLRVFGNGVEYETGYFIATTIKALHDCLYEDKATNEKIE